MTSTIMPQPTLYANDRNAFPLARMGDYFKVTQNGQIDETPLRVYNHTGLKWKLIDGQTDTLNGKNFYGFSDSMNMLTGNPATVTLYDRIAEKYGMFRVKKIGTTELARSGATLEKRTPINKIGSPNMVDWSSAQYCPVFNPQTDGLIFCNFLTNDVGLNHPEYNLDNYEADLRTVITNLQIAGWHVDNIKFVFRHFITDIGLNYVGNPTNSGVTVPATLTRYHDFAERGIYVCNELGVQFFDFWKLFENNNPALLITEMDTPQRHSKNMLYAIEAVEVFKELYCRDFRQ